MKENHLFGSFISTHSGGAYSAIAISNKRLTFREQPNKLTLFWLHRKDKAEGLQTLIFQQLSPS